MKLGIGLSLANQRFGSLIKLFINKFSGASLALSLRLVNVFYKGFIITVRRSSDNLQRGFYAAEIIGTAMRDWVNTPVVKFESDFVSGSAQFNYTERVTLETGETIGGEANAVKITLTGGNGSHRFGKADFIELYKIYNLTFDLYIPSSNAEINQMYIQRPVNNQYVSIDPDTWVSLSFTGTNDSNNDMLFLAAKDGNTVIDADGDVFYMKNVTLTQLTADGFVPTIFDQIGSHNMEQPLSSLQGSIILNGEINLKNGKPCILRSENNNGSYISTYKPNDGATVKGLFYVGDNEGKRCMLLGSSISSYDQVLQSNEGNTAISSVNVSQTLTKINGNNSNSRTKDRAFIEMNKEFILYSEIEFNFDNNILGFGYRHNDPSNIGMYTFQELVIFENTDENEAKTTAINNYYQKFPDIGGFLNFFNNSSFGLGLRQMNKNYIDSVITVRRSSNNDESEIISKNISGNKILDFVNTPVVRFQSNFVFGSNQFNYSLGLDVTTGESIGGQDDALKAVLNGGNRNHNLAKLDYLSQNKYFTLTFDLYIPSSNSLVDGLKIISPITGNNLYSPTLNTWKSFFLEGKSEELSENDLWFRASNGDNSSNIDADGDVFYLKNIVLTQKTADGFGVNFNDQSGNGVNFNQTALSSAQPQIVRDGELILANGKPTFDFDGIYDHFRCPDDDFITVTDKLQVSVVIKNAKSSLSENEYIIGQYGSGQDERSWAILINNQKKIRINLGDSSNGRFVGGFISNEAINPEKLQTIGFTYNSGTILIYANGFILDGSLISGIIPSTLFNSSADVTIGCVLSNNIAVALWNGQISDSYLSNNLNDDIVEIQKDQMKNFNITS